MEKKLVYLDGLETKWSMIVLKRPDLDMLVTVYCLLTLFITSHLIGNTC